MTQDQALAILKTGANVFLTGEPGSGKSHTVNTFVSYLRDRSIEPAITASTGIAATHIGGYTIHSWSGIGIKRYLTEYDLDAIANNKSVYERIRDNRVLIIDEVSMLSNATLSMVDAVCREIRHDGRPFGGMQVILVGDFFQLPPINSREDRNAGQELFETAGGAGFSFRSDAWQRLQPLVCYLSEQHRQEDEVFLEFLTAMRRGAIEDAHRELLKSRHKASPEGMVTQLYSHNADVDQLNSSALGKLSGQSRIFQMESKGPEKLLAGLKRGCLSPETLELKEGARVMFTKNDHVLRRYANGTIGTITGFDSVRGFPVVQLKSGRTLVVEPDQWSIQDGGRLLAQITQVPLRLAWAMTVHKSQGMSLDSAHMDLSNAFEYGQGYVALSRVRTLDGLSLAGINERALEVHPEILEQDETFRRQSDEAAEAFARINDEELVRMHQNFVRASGGKEPIPGVKRKEVSEDIEPRKKRLPKEMGLQKTYDLIKEGKSIKEVAQERALAETTILSHLEELQESGKLTARVLQHLVEGHEQGMEEIHDALDEVGVEKLKPLFEHLEGRYPYETLRLARLLYVLQDRE